MLSLYEKELTSKSAELKKLYLQTNLIPRQYDPSNESSGQQRRSLDSACYFFQEQGQYVHNYLTGSQSDTRRAINKVVVYGESKGVLS